VKRLPKIYHLFKIVKGNDKNYFTAAVVQIRYQNICKNTVFGLILFKLKSCAILQNKENISFCLAVLNSNGGKNQLVYKEQFYIILLYTFCFSKTKQVTGMRCP